MLVEDFWSGLQIIGVQSFLSLLSHCVGEKEFLSIHVFFSFFPLLIFLLASVFV